MYTSLYLSGTCSLPGSEKGRSVNSCKVTSNGGFSSFPTLAALRSRLRHGSGSSWSEKVEKTGLAALRSELTRGVSGFWVSAGKSEPAVLRSELTRRLVRFLVSMGCTSGGGGSNICPLELTGGCRSCRWPVGSWSRRWSRRSALSSLNLLASNRFNSCCVNSAVVS